MNSPVAGGGAPESFFSPGQAERAAAFLWSAPVAFRRVALETPEWTSRDSNHHRQSVSAGKTNAIPTEPSGRLTDRAVWVTFALVF